MPFPITALAPARPATADDPGSGSDSDSSSGGGASLGRTSAKRRRDDGPDVVTPGERITADPQWMRGHGTHLHGPTASITASVAGTVAQTNKLLSVRPLRARYAPEVGDLVVGRVVEVQARRWRVDVGAAQLAALPLSAVNLPGGILRRRTDADELQMRALLAEGDAVVAEVQQLFADGAAGLHARSLRYGKLRNGLAATLGPAAVVRSRRQAWDFAVPGPRLGDPDAAERVEVVLGVNGYCFFGARPAAAAEAAAAAAATGGAGVMNQEDAVSASVYSSQNEPVAADTVREVARVRCVAVALAEGGLRVDEDSVMRAYRLAVDEAREHALPGRGEDAGPGGAGEGIDYLGGERGRRLRAAMLEAA